MTEQRQFQQQDVPTFIKLRDGNWGIRFPGVIENMDQIYSIQATRKNGKTQTVPVKFFWTNRSDATLGEIVNPDGTKKTPKPQAVASGGQVAQQPQPQALGQAVAPAPVAQPPVAAQPAPAAHPQPATAAPGSAPGAVAAFEAAAAAVGMPVQVQPATPPAEGPAF